MGTSKARITRLQIILWIAVVLLGAFRCFRQIHYDPSASAPVKEEAVRTGYFLYHSGEWSNPYWSLDTGPTAHTAPGFPAVVAAIYRLFGDGAPGAYMLQAVEAIVLTLQFALIPLVMHALGASYEAGVLAAFLAVLGVRQVPNWEANYVGLLLLIATLLACRYLRSLSQNRNSMGFGNSPLSIASLLGVVWGSILLLNPSPLFIWVVWLILGSWQSWRHGFAFAWLPALILPLMMLIPWEWRNYRVFHAFVPVRTNFGLELRVSNSPWAKASFYANFYHHYFPHPNADVEEAKKVLAMGEVEYNRRQLQDAIQWIRANPRQALTLWGTRFRLFWLPPHASRIPEWTIDLATLMSIVGLFFLARTNRAEAILCLIFLTIYPPIYYILQNFDRYRYPILWVTFGLAAVACSQTVEFLSRLRRPRLAHVSA